MTHCERQYSPTGLEQLQQPLSLTPNSHNPRSSLLYTTSHKAVPDSDSEVEHVVRYQISSTASTAVQWLPSLNLRFVSVGCHSSPTPHSLLRALTATVSSDAVVHFRECAGREC